VFQGPSSATTLATLSAAFVEFPRHPQRDLNHEVERTNLMYGLSFQFYEEQNEDCPYSNSYRKLHQHCISHCISSWKCKGKQKHGQGCEYAKGYFGS
jgi:hypothetical protein